MVQRDILDGPSKFDLMLALFDGDAHHRRRVAFVFSNDKLDWLKQWFRELEVVISEIARKDDSDELWLFKGYVPWSPEPLTVEGFFSTQTRKGCIKLTNFTGSPP